jgi:hypothetical protein
MASFEQIDTIVLIYTLLAINQPKISQIDPVEKNPDHFYIDGSPSIAWPILQAWQTGM